MAKKKRKKSRTDWTKWLIAIATVVSAIANLIAALKK